MLPKSSLSLMSPASAALVVAASGRLELSRWMENPRSLRGGVASLQLAADDGDDVGEMIAHQHPRAVGVALLQRVEDELVLLVVAAAIVVEVEDGHLLLDVDLLADLGVWF